MKLLDDAIHSDWKTTTYDQECELFALPARFGGLGIGIPSRNASRELHSSLLVTSALHDHILSQDADYSYDILDKQMESRALVRKENKERSSKEAENLNSLLPDYLQRVMELATEKGASTWPTALPLS